jgi:hypothetical protein
VVSGGRDAGSERSVQSRQVLHSPGFAQDENAEEDGAAPLCWLQPGQEQLSPHPQVDGNDGLAAVEASVSSDGRFDDDTAAASRARS